jgi:hypothetical protein
MNPMSLARVTLEEPPSVRGVGVNPWRQAETHSRSWGWLMEKPSRRRRWEQPTASGETVSTKYPSRPPDWTTKVFKLYGSYYDEALKTEVKYWGVRWWLGELIMFFAGFISGLLGIGSGALKVLGMDWAMNLPMKVSTTTSNFMIGVTAATGSALYWYFGYIQPMMAAVTAIGVLIGAMSGTKILVRITNKQVRWVFLAILAFLGMEMLLKGLYMDHIITIPVATQYALSLIFTAIVMSLLYYRYGVLARKSNREGVVLGGGNA